MAIFTDGVETFVEVFTDDLLIFGSSYDYCLKNLANVLEQCEETISVLNWEKFHFTVQEDIVLGHIVSSSDIEVHKTKVDPVAKFPPPISMKGVRSFLGYVNYPTTKNEFFAVLWAFEKFLAYLVGTKVIVYNGGNQEFDVDIQDQKGIENQVFDHMSLLHIEEGGQIKETFPDKQLVSITHDPALWYRYYVNYLVTGVFPPKIQAEARKRFLNNVNIYYWNEPFL
ncbi:uncharacterized protein LOC142176198 [Nicotiana tabacum]|uniref:Uncharacterized protein LOC142176198 n=1 Tax=Nicotiana tabacum TaxID=4097 RepID=A0AC58TQB2_TOBAC